MSSEAQNNQVNGNAAFVEPDHMPDLAHPAQLAPAAASDSIESHQLARMAHDAHMGHMAHHAHLGHMAQPINSSLVAASSTKLPPDQPLAVTVLPAPAAASHAVEQQEVWSAELSVAVLGQQVTNRAPALAVAPDEMQRDEVQRGELQGAELQRDADSSSVSAADQPSEIIPAHAPVAAGQIVEQMAMQGAEADTAVPGQGETAGGEQSALTVAATAEYGTAHSGGISAGVAEHVAAHEVVSGGAAQGIGADAANAVTAEQQAADDGVRSELPRAAHHAAASAAFGAQHAGLQAGSIASLSAVPQGMQRAKRAAVEEDGKDVTRRKGINNTRLLSDSNDSIAEAMQLDVHTNTDMSMRRTVRRRAVKERC